MKVSMIATTVSNKVDIIRENKLKRSVSLPPKSKKIGKGDSKSSSIPTMKPKHASSSTFPEEKKRQNRYNNPKHNTRNDNSKNHESSMFEEEKKSVNIDGKDAQKSPKKAQKHGNPQDLPVNLPVSHTEVSDETELEKNPKKPESRRVKSNSDGIEVRVDRKGAKCRGRRNKESSRQNAPDEPNLEIQEPQCKEKLNESVSAEDSVFYRENRPHVEMNKRREKKGKIYGRKKNRVIEQGHGHQGDSNEIPFHHTKKYRPQKSWKKKQDLVVYGTKIYPCQPHESFDAEQVMGLNEKSNQPCQDSVNSYSRQSTEHARNEHFGIKSASQDAVFSHLDLTPQNGNFTNEAGAAILNSLRASKEKDGNVQEQAAYVTDSEGLSTSSPINNEYMAQNPHITPLEYSEVPMIDPSTSAMMYQSSYPPLYTVPYCHYPHPSICNDPNVPYIYPIPPDMNYDFMGHQRGYFVTYCPPYTQNSPVEMYYIDHMPPSQIYHDTRNLPVESNNEFESQASSEGLSMEKKVLNVEAPEWNGPCELSSSSKT